MSNEVISRLKPISQRLSEAVCWLQQVKLNHRFQRPIYDGLTDVYWLLRDLKALGEAEASSPVLPCHWAKDEDFEGRVYWDTQCGEAYTLINGTLDENRHEFCPFCGGRIVLKLAALTPPTDTAP